ncbi:MAG: hypothetical protein KAR38_09160 [Calditrichia bacterium]|nr:hypothetical protein [Calditrichia bacterium]
MKKIKQIDEEVKKTLKLLDQTEKIEINPFFYTRLKSQLKNPDRKYESSMIFGLNSSLLRNELIVFIILLNIFSSIYVLQNDNYQAESRNDYISILSGEYSSEQNFENYTYKNGR